MANEFLFQMMSEKEIEIQNKVLELFNKHAPELSESVKKKIGDIEAESRLKISFVGQHNAGKSTIVSALTKNKNIKISSNVETDETASYEWNDIQTRMIANALNIEEAEVLRAVNEYTEALVLLDKYDHQVLEKPKGNTPIYRITYEDCTQLVSKMRDSFNTDTTPNYLLLGDIEEDDWMDDMIQILQKISRPEYRELA